MHDTPRGWFLEIDGFLKSLGAIKTKLDNALYIFKDRRGKIIGFILSHVDDFVFAGEPSFHNDIIAKVMRKYVIGDTQIEDFTFTGWNLVQTRDGITITQADYLSGIDLTLFDEFSRNGMKNNTPLTMAQNTLFRKMTGILGWVCQVSKPHLSFNYVEASHRAHQATLGDAKKALQGFEQGQD